MTNATAKGLRHDYLVVADLTGYTKLLTGTELEHAQAIVDELTSLIVDCLAPPLRLVKLEGDAVLCCGAGPTIADGERLLELIEVCYFTFVDRRRGMAGATTCTCAACAAIGDLDLKFIAHHGEFLAHEMAGVHDIAGPDVILVHRLLKNSIAERTGCRAYAFFTDTCLTHLPRLQQLERHAETYDELGEVSGGVYDLRPLLEGRQGPARRYVGSGDADFEFFAEFDCTPAELWPYLLEPEKRLLWQGGLAGVESTPNEQNRLGVGALSHCDHGSWRAEQRYVDWRPFSYYTLVSRPTKMSTMALRPSDVTVELRPLDGRTEMAHRIRLHDRSWPSRMGLRVFAPLVRRAFRQDVERLRAALAARDAA